jgi:hypothetical protein
MRFSSLFPDESSHLFYLARDHQSATSKSWKPRAARGAAGKGTDLTTKSDAPAKQVKWRNERTKTPTTLLVTVA